MNLRTRTLAALAGAAIIVGACQAAYPERRRRRGGGLDGALVKRSDIKIEIVTHGQAQDGFWGVVRNGVKAGAADMGVTANYSAPGAESDMPGMSALIDAAVAKKPTGLVVSIPNPEALSPVDREGHRGRDPGRVDELRFRRLQGSRDPRPRRARPSTRPASAPASGSRTAGVKNAVCFNQEVGNQALTLRCNGFFMGLTGSEEGEVLTGNISDPAGMQATIEAKLASDADHRRRPDPRSVRRRTRRLPRSRQPAGPSTSRPSTSAPTC